MSSISSAATPRRVPDFDVRELRHPSEIPALLACICANVTLITIAIAVVFAGGGWLEDHPVVFRYADAFRAIGTAAILMFPATLIGRRSGLEDAHANGIRVTENQFPELHAELLRVCERLGVTEVPHLYIGKVHDGVAHVHSVYGRRHSILITSDWIFDKQWIYGKDWLSFIIAGAVGAIRLGHTRWWIEMLTGYAKHIPGLRTPLLVAWTLSRDRCAAYAVPDGLRGLVVIATGKDLVWAVDIGEVMKQEVPNGFWAWVAALKHKTPHLMTRARALYDAGLFDHRRDVERAAEWKKLWEEACERETGLAL